LIADFYYLQLYLHFLELPHDITLFDIDLYMDLTVNYSSELQARSLIQLMHQLSKLYSLQLIACC